MIFISLFFFEYGDGISIGRMLLSVAILLVASDGVLAQVPTPAHVVIVIEENHDYSQIIGSSAAAYINALAADANGALFTHSSALTHPSQPNYLMLFSGSNQGVTNDNVPSGLPFISPNLGASLTYSGHSFAGYSEDLPSVGFTGASSGAYARKHNPWVNWQNSTVNGTPLNANLPLTSFPSDYDSLPAVSFVVPNQDNDMHNGSDPSTISAGDTWVRTHLDSYVQWAKANNSLFILTFDEGTNSGSNQIVTIFVGAMVKPGRYTESINHYSLLRTLEEMFGLPHAAGSLSVTSLTDCWTVATGIRAAGEPVPRSTLLRQCYPNPFNPRTVISYYLAVVSEVKLLVYDVLGRMVAVLVDEVKMPGSHSVAFDGSGLGSGVYFCQFKAGTVFKARKMVLAK